MAWCIIIFCEDAFQLRVLCSLNDKISDDYELWGKEDVKERGHDVLYQQFHEETGKLPKTSVIVVIICAKIPDRDLNSKQPQHQTFLSVALQPKSHLLLFIIVAGVCNIVRRFAYVYLHFAYHKQFAHESESR